MKRERTNSLSGGLDHLAERARGLIAATAEVADSNVVEARERLAHALDGCKASWGQVRQCAVKSARSTDEAIRRHPYRALGFALGGGALLALLLSRRG